jgi:class 3 adenylate cyclase
MADEPTLIDVARILAVSPALRRRVAEGIVPLQGGAWTPAALARARIGSALYRDGDYYGRAVNVGARATGGEVLVTRAVKAAAGRHLTFQPIGEVKLKGFDEATELFLAAPR